MSTVALDGRGAERGAETLVAGARMAAADGIGLRVFGDPAELAALAGLDGVEVVPAPDEITNDDEPAAAVRTRPDASVVVAAHDVAEGRAGAMASAGPTGATMAAALFALRRMPGVRRPALALQLTSPGGSGLPTLLLDVGANSEVRSQDLVQFAYLGAAFSQAVLGVTRPRVGLLSVGEEPKKGSREVVEAHEQLVRLGGSERRPADPSGGEVSGRALEFVGNVEGRDLFTGAADVIVTDGFTGNVVLKTMEGTARAVGAGVATAARSGPRAALGGLLLRPALAGLRSQMNPDTTGGAILLGLRGVSVVAHGSSGPEGIANAIRLAARAADERAVERTERLLADSGASRGDLRRDSKEEA